MADITKCSNGCSKQLLCKRWTTPASQFYQSYADFHPDEELDGSCAHYWPNAVAEVTDE